MARGRLIVFEGLDRSGKSTQCERLVAYLKEKGVPVRHRRFPGMQTFEHLVFGYDAHSILFKTGRHQ